MARYLWRVSSYGDNPRSGRYDIHFNGSFGKLKKKIENNDQDSAPFLLTTEMLMLRSIERGLSIKDWDCMTVGMLIDFITTYNNENLSEEEKQDDMRIAGQSDFNNF
jgi:hypothetical protein